MEKVMMSIEESRNVLSKELSEYTKNAGGKTITKTLHFENDDVERFLTTLRDFEKRSRQIDLFIK